MSWPSEHRANSPPFCSLLGYLALLSFLQARRDQVEETICPTYFVYI